jgi:hypothetical protein
LCYGIANQTNLELFKEDIETIKIPVEIMGDGIVAAVRARMFFSHMCHSITSLLFLQLHTLKKEVTKERISVLNMLICRQAP